MFKSFLKSLVNFPLPPVCVCCEGLLTNDEEFICTGCFASLVKVEPDYSLKADKFADADFIKHAFGIYWFREGSGIQSIIHSLKYAKMKSIGRIFGRIIGGEIIEKYGNNYEYVIPVPLHRSKLRERTFNQSSYICKGISDILNTEVLEKCLQRNRYTMTQTRLNINERKDNVKDAFALNKKYAGSIQGKNIVLVDDVITTGATILECGGVLHQHGAAQIDVCSIALAELGSNT